jgi:regulator of sigma E protease
VKWQLCILPFGGYVRIAGMEKKGNLEPHQIPDGFYGKKPSQRIKVALAGPISNILFSFVAFTLIWLAGGQERPFQELTRVVGYVDTDSSLKKGSLQPGDLISSFNEKPYDGYGDLLIKTALSDGVITLQGDHLNYWLGQKKPFSVSLPPAPTPVERINQLGILPAQYLVFDHFSSPAAPLKGSGIEPGDRLIWVNGSLLFSQRQLSSVLNDSTVLLTIQRENSFHQIHVQRLKIADLRISQLFKNELDDWRHAASMQGNLSDLYFIPYQISSTALIEDALSFMNENAEEVIPSEENRVISSEKLQAGDRIIAIDAAPIENAFNLFKMLQERKALVIVQKKTPSALIPWKEADPIFESSFDITSLKQIIQTIGTSAPQFEVGNLKLLPPVQLKPLVELDLDKKTRAQVIAQYEAQKKEIEKIENLEMRETQLSLLEQSQKRLMLGASLTDRRVSYNPPPTTQFAAVFGQTWKTLSHLFTGSLTPKSMSGPVGIVQALQQSWANGVKDALYWLGFVSLNLAILNLLPIPVLDGGHILFSVVEVVTKKPIRAQTMQKWIIPFLILLVILFIYLTYQDIVRLLHRLF